jgi:predicted lipoprotein
LLEFGPEASISLRSYINTYPVTISKLDANIASGSYDLEQFGNKDAQGFPAIDYLLNGIASTNAGVITNYTTDAQATSRKQYLQALATKMLTKVTDVKTAWNTYRNTYVSSTGTDAGSSISLTTNAFIQYYERYLRSGKVGLPAGSMTGVAAPTLTEAYYTPTLSKELAVAAMNAVKNFYNGKGYSNNTDGMGFNDYLMAIGTKDQNGKAMATVINDNLTSASNSLSSFPATIRAGVSNNRPEILAIYEQLQAIVPLLKVDMVSAFGISITFTDNDGD